MSRVKHATILVVVLAVLLTARGWGTAESPRPLSEADVLKLVELQIDDDAILGRIERAWVSFKVDEDVLRRLKGAGASDAVLARLRAGQKADLAEKPLAEDPGKDSVMVWVERAWSQDCPLHSDFRVNGQLVNVFSSDSQQAIGKHLKMGWNLITLKTSVKGPEKKMNFLRFKIGPTHRDPKSDKLVMDSVLWQFDSGTDWQEKDGKIRNRLGPDVKDVTLSFNLYFAGLKRETATIKEGDYVLQAAGSYSHNPVVTTTVVVNGTPLNTFVLPDKTQLVITDLLRKGKNEVKIITHGLKDTASANDVTCDIGGPAEYSLRQEKWMLKPVVQFKSMPGWVQDEKTLRWHVKDKPDSNSFERAVTFYLDEAPKVKPAKD
jgi:hypothetical protein